MEKKMENELEKLGQSKVPAADDTARARALTLAMNAFDAEKKSSQQTQGNENPHRQSSILTQLWSTLMNKRLLAGSALATLLVIPAAGYVTYGMIQQKTITLIDVPVLADVKSKSSEPAVLDAPKVVLQTEDMSIEAKEAYRRKIEAENQMSETKVVPTGGAIRLMPKDIDAKVGATLRQQMPGAEGEKSKLENDVAKAPEQPVTKAGEDKKEFSEGLVSEKQDAEEQEQGAIAVRKPVPATEEFRRDEDEATFAVTPSQPVMKDSLFGNRASGSRLRSQLKTEKKLAIGQAAAAPLDTTEKFAETELKAGILITPDGVYKTDGDVVADPQVAEPKGQDRFTSEKINPVKAVANEPVSTFSIDVDTASYSYARQALMAGQLPPTESVRVEEMVNYFPYDWQGPESAKEPFKANITVMPTPWNKDTKLMHVAVKGYEMNAMADKPSNIVFLIDVSGSMDEPNKLPLLKNAFRLLINKLKPSDTVSIVVYAGSSGVVLEPTKVAKKRKILEALDNLQAGGSTAGAEGINAAYKMAEDAFVKDGVNRIFLATDGDFNVGASSDEELKKIIEEKRKSGIFLSVLGFGTGNYNDAMMQTLAQNGNGIAAYIDTLSEAQKTLVQEATSSLFPIAKDVKIQVEFNPAKIAEYRLIGYETRALNKEDFNNDRVDAGDIGSGHSVTAIYEVTPTGSPAVLNDSLRYGKPQITTTDKTVPAIDGNSDELAFVKIRYKRPNEDTSNLITMPVKDIGNDEVRKDSKDVLFSVAVAAFAQKLKDEPQVATYSWDQILKLGREGKGADTYGYRGEFLNMVELAKGLKSE